MHFTEKKMKQKRRSKRCRFERHHKPSFSPGHAENRGRRSCFPLRFASLSLPKPENHPESTPLAWTLSDGLPRTKNQRGKAPQAALGRLHRDRPCHPALSRDWTGQGDLPLYSAYK